MLILHKYTVYYQNVFIKEFLRFILFVLHLDSSNYQPCVFTSICHGIPIFKRVSKAPQNHQVDISAVYLQAGDLIVSSQKRLDLSTKGAGCPWNDHNLRLDLDAR